MSDPTALETVRTLSPMFNALGGRWMLHAETMGAAGPAGYANGFLLYAAGRGGVLGDVDPAVIVSAFGFFNPDLVGPMWQAGSAVEGARAVADRYTRLCVEWGRRRLVEVEGVDRFAELLSRVLDSTSVIGLSLFAGWRAVPRPDDAAGRAYLLCHIAREWRGSAHVVAIASLGLTPAESILNDEKNGPATAKLFGWSEPFPDVSAAKERRDRAEDITDEMLVAGYEALSGPERAELIELARQVEAALDAAA